MTARAPDVQLLGHAVLLQGEALTLINHLAAAGAADMTRRNGAVLSPRTRALLGSLARADAAARSAVGHLDVREEPTSRPSEWVGCEEVAGELGVSARHIRRLAEGGLLPGHRHRRDWRFDLDEVRAFRAQRERDTA